MTTTTPAKKKKVNRDEIARNETSQTVAAASELVGIKPPQAIDVEKAVLGAIMLEKNAILAVQDVLKADSFYLESHQLIFQAVLELSANLGAIDLLTVTQQLKKNDNLQKIGGPAYISELTQAIGSAAHLEFHAKIVAQKHVQRQLIAASTNIQKSSFSDEYDVDELINLAEGEIFKIAEGSVKRDVQSAREVIAKALARIEEVSKIEGGLSGVNTGFEGIDKLTAGWQRSDLIIIAARPSMGKTAFVLSMARNIAVDYNHAVVFFSLEMSTVQLMMRLIIGESGISSDNIKRGNLTPDEWTHLAQSVKPLEACKMFIDDTPALSIFEFRSKVRRLKAREDIQLIIIDYLQLMTAGTSDNKGNREQEVAMISRSLKAIAKELDVPIIALSQLNRSVESRGGARRPQLSDLRESGAIEQDADIVAFIHRPKYYGINELEDGTPTDGLAEIIFAKHRNGAVDDVRLKFIAEQAKFTDWTDDVFNSLGSGNYKDVASSGFGTAGSDDGVDQLSASQGRIVMQNDSFGDAPF